MFEDALRPVLLCAACGVLLCATCGCLARLAVMNQSGGLLCSKMRCMLSWFAPHMVFLARLAVPSAAHQKTDGCTAVTCKL